MGAALGALTTTAIGARLGIARTVTGCHLLSALAVATMASAVLAPHGRPCAVEAALLLGTGQLLHGYAMEVSNSHEMSYRQRVTPDELQGRTNTTLRSANRAIIVVVAPPAGLVATVWGNAPSLLGASAVFLLAAGCLLASGFRHAR